MTGFPCHGPGIWGIVVNSLGWYILLGIVSLVNLFFDAFNEPSLVGHWIVVVGLPTHSEVVAQQKEGLQEHNFFIAWR